MNKSKTKIKEFLSCKQAPSYLLHDMKITTIVSATLLSPVVPGVYAKIVIQGMKVTPTAQLKQSNKHLYWPAAIQEDAGDR